MWCSHLSTSTMKIRPPIPSHMMVTIQSPLLCNSKKLQWFSVTPVHQLSTPNILQSCHMFFKIWKHLPNLLCQAMAVPSWFAFLPSFLTARAILTTLAYTFFNISAQSADNRRFATAGTTELSSLMSRRMFSIVHEDESAGHRIYGSRSVDTFNHEGQPNAFEKSRLVFQAFIKKEHGILSHAPTMQRGSMRLLLTLCAGDKDLTLFTCDVSQAFG